MGECDNVVVLVTGSRDLPCNGVVESMMKRLHDELVGTTEPETFSLVVDEQGLYYFERMRTLTIRDMICPGEKGKTKSDRVTSPHHIVLIHGNARGADRYAKDCARELGWVVVDCDPDWKSEGKRAGLTRNKSMVDDYRPHFVLAFPLQRGKEKVSKGTEHCIACVKKYAPKGRLVDLRITYTDVQ